MFGFLFGTACLIGIFAVARGRRRWRGHGHWGGPWGGRGPLYGVLARLGTTPGQEKAISAAVDEFLEVARAGRGTLKQTRGAAAKAVGGADFDEAALREAFAAQDSALDGIREAAVSAGKKIHDVLDERQRKTLAELIESGPGFAHHGYGHGCGHRAAYC
ncbi:MAG TPA: hypothetical protein VGP93_05405 [Polyangiaceae bacterium]|jgi:Spy/CpxP family protein refolding chaperone|nr:hypothetical protein [Polyangiaceae bacterium]